jgi:hypothetical protein
MKSSTIAARIGAIDQEKPFDVPDILVRNIDEVVAERIKTIAREREWSINDTILYMLKQSLGLGGDDAFHRGMHDIAVLAGTWDPREAAAFRSAVEAFEQVDGQPLFSDTEKAPEDQPKPDEPASDKTAPE